jgi:gliding motility-associated protein GldM
VFIAMLALQISKEVLATLGIVSEDMEKSTAQLITVIDKSYDEIFVNSNQDYYKIPSEELPKLREITNDYFDFLQKFKDSLIKLDENEFKINVEYIDDEGNQIISKRTDYQVMDKSNYLDETFFINDGVTAKGQKFIDNFKGFSTKVESVLDSITNRDARTVQSNYNFENAITSLSQRFDYPEDDQVVNRDGIKEAWIYYNYEKFPLVASLTKITKIQADIRTVEYEILNSLIQKTQKRKLDLSGSATLLESEPVYYTNSIANPAVLVGRTDPNFKPDIIDLKIDGVALKESERKVENGKIILNKRFYRVGQKNIKGFLIFESDGKIDSLRVDQNFYVVNKPNKALVSLVNMQVLYTGLRNEMDIAFPGIDDLSSIRARGVNGEIWRDGQSYFARPNKDVDSMDVIISGKAKGQTITSTLRYEVRDEPSGEASVVQKKGGVTTSYTNDENKISKNALIYGIITGERPEGMLYDYSIDIKAFKITIVGVGSTREINGNRVRNNDRAVRDIESARSGTAVTITPLKAEKNDGGFKSSTNVKKLNLVIE